MSQQNAFDFLVGNWNVHHRYLRRRLAGCTEWIEFAGTSSMRKILDGFANMDDDDIHLPAGRYAGVSLRTYDPKNESWSIYWLDSRYSGRIDPPLAGRFDDGIGTFYGDDTFEGRPIRVRFLWSRITPTSARWEQAFSDDEGNSWETNWYMDFTRM
ncbi:MAG: DUF1579 domain-containing protein [Reyranella sp.]|nr:MAG: DUF1579 domain-containing protein [Reyranella sp.]